MAGWKGVAWPAGKVSTFYTILYFVGKLDSGNGMVNWKGNGTVLFNI